MYMQSKGITLLHTGDLHLGFPYSGLKEKAAERQQDNLETFLYIISLCRSRNVDILLAAGDLFDTGTGQGAVKDSKESVCRHSGYSGGDQSGKSRLL